MIPRRSPGRSALRSSLLLGLVAVASCSDPNAPAELPEFVFITTGASHSCALTEDGEAFCWGRGETGALGTGRTVASATPRSVDGPHRFLDVSGGGEHTCGVKTNLEGFCWGSDELAQLGINGTGDSAVPVVIAGLRAYEAISAGGSHTCTITSDSNVRCFGWNRFGQLGTGRFIDLGSPADPVEVGEVFATVSAGLDFSCGITASGRTYCWGRNDLGQLGTDAAAESCVTELVAGPCSTLPLPVTTESAFRTITAGETHACALDDAGRAFCWGDGTLGALGHGVQEVSSAPVPVSGGHRFAVLSAGADHTCGVTTDGTALCWGQNAHGRLGTGDAVSAIRPTPAPVDAAASFSSIAAGRLHTCALDDDGVAYCWGFGGFGQLGDGRSISSAVPVRVRRS